jgi:hypothetical protein
MTRFIPSYGATGGALVLDGGVSLAVAVGAPATLDGSTLGVGVAIGIPVAPPPSPTVDMFEVTHLAPPPHEDNIKRLACYPELGPLVSAM